MRTLMFTLLLFLVGCAPKETIYVPKPDLGNAAKFIAVDTEKAELQLQNVGLSQEVQTLRLALKEATKGGYTGAHIIYADWCNPCHAEINAIKGRAKVGWTIGTTDKTHFRLVPYDDSMKDVTNLPTTIYYKDGKEIGRIEGFDGSKEALDAILLKHPACKKYSASKAAQQMSAPVTEIIVPQVWFEWSIP